MKTVKRLTYRLAAAAAFVGIAFAPAAAQASTDLSGFDLTGVTSQLSPVTGEFLTVADGTDNHTTPDSGKAIDWASNYGSVTLHDKQSGVINNNGAPFVNVDLRCVDAMGGIGGYANAVLGNSAKCNSADVSQYHDGGILG